MDKLAFLLLLVAEAVFCQLDSTRAPNVVGPEVVEAVVDIIKQTCIFPDDKLYLRRLAYVESLDGLDAATYKPDAGGIWRVSKDAFYQTQTAPYLSHFRDEVHKTLFIDWSITRFDDLRKPLFSGLAAALFTTLKVGNQGIPSTVSGQASLWAAGRAQSGIFIQRIQMLKMHQRVTVNDLDIAFLLDSIAGLTESSFNKTKQFVADVVSGLYSYKMRFAIVALNTGVYPKFFLNSYTTSAEILRAVKNVTYTPGATDTTAGLQYIMSDIFTPAHGARRTAGKVLILITDGQSDDPAGVVTAAAALKDAGVKILTVGVGDKVDKFELEAIASIPACRNALTATNFTDLASLKDEVEAGSLNAEVFLHPGVYTFSCSSTIYAQLLSNTSSGTTLTLSTREGSVEVFGSWDPKFRASSAFHSFSDIATFYKPVKLFMHAAEPTKLTFRNNTYSGGCHSRFFIIITNGDTRTPDGESTCIEDDIISNCTSKDLAGTIFAWVPPTAEQYNQSLCINTDAMDLLRNPLLLKIFVSCGVQGVSFGFCHLNTVSAPTTSDCGQLPRPTTVFTQKPTTSVTRNPTTIYLTRNPTTIHLTRNLTTSYPFLFSSPQTGQVTNHCTLDYTGNQPNLWPYPGDPTKFIKCGSLPGYQTVLSCPPHKIVSVAHKTCLYQEVVVDLTAGIFSGIANPCTSGNKISFLSHPTDPHKFIQCDQYGDGYEKTCPLNELWDEHALSCVNTVHGQIVGR